MEESMAVTVVAVQQPNGGERQPQRPQPIVLRGEGVTVVLEGRSKVVF